MADTTTERPGRLTWDEVYDRSSVGDIWPLGIVCDWARETGWCYARWQGDVYRVAIEGVAGAIDPPERLGTVEEIMGEADNG